MDSQPVIDFFQQTPRLAELCTQNGWPDPDTLRIDITEQHPGELLCDVSFDEVIMEGAGCEAGRVPCWGRYRVTVDHSEVNARLEMGVGIREL